MATSSAFSSSFGNSGPMFCQNAFVIVARPFFWLPSHKTSPQKNHHCIQRIFHGKKMAQIH